MSWVTASKAQNQYQVRFEWGVAGAREVVSGDDILVWVDVLGSSSPDVLRSELGDATVIAGSLNNRTAIAQWVTQRQAAKGDRVAVAVIAAGELRPDGGLQFAVEDLLGAGAIIDALAAEGHDYSSPEAAAACAAFTGLRGAVGHLVSASTTGKELAESGAASAIENAARVDSSTAVVEL